MIRIGSEIYVPRHAALCEVGRDHRLGFNKLTGLRGKVAADHHLVAVTFDGGSQGEVFLVDRRLEKQQVQGDYLRTGFAQPLNGGGVNPPLERITIQKPEFGATLQDFFIIAKSVGSKRPIVNSQDHHLGCGRFSSTQAKTHIHRGEFLAHQQEHLLFVSNHHHDRPEQAHRDDPDATRQQESPALPGSRLHQ